ncbi:MAG: hypothetical protein V3R87_10100 [Dehalococcoidia bacterium]
MGIAEESAADWYSAFWGRSARFVQDDRTEAEKRTHTVAVVGTDPFMSGWGEASRGASYAAWACRPEDLLEAEVAVRARGDLDRVRRVTLKGYRPQADHTHVYVWKRRTSWR